MTSSGTTKKPAESDCKITSDNIKMKLFTELDSISLSINSCTNKIMIIILIIFTILFPVLFPIFCILNYLGIISPNQVYDSSLLIFLMIIMLISYIGYLILYYSILRMESEKRNKYVKKKLDLCYNFYISEREIEEQKREIEEQKREIEEQKREIEEQKRELMEYLSCDIIARS